MMMLLLLEIRWTWTCQSALRVYVGDGQYNTLCRRKKNGKGLAVIVRLYRKQSKVNHGGALLLPDAKRFFRAAANV